MYRHDGVCKKEEVKKLSWTKSSNGIPISGSSTPESIPTVLFAADASDIYAGTVDNGIFFSSDAGKNRSKQAGFPANALITSFTRTSTGQMFAGIWENGVYSLTTGGMWTRFKPSRFDGNVVYLLFIISLLLANDDKIMKTLDNFND